MTFSESIFLVLTLAGGLALFLFGMGIMTDGLRHAAGNRLHSLLSRATDRRVTGFAVGILAGTIVHSSAATVMLVGFVDAGLLTLARSIPAVLGANVGTTLSMQAVSLKLGDYCFLAIALGSLLRAIGKERVLGHAGSGLLGFGLLFLGMNVMGDAITPHRESLTPLLTQFDGNNLGGLLGGIVVSALLTAIWQSSGATIAICFALVSAGVFTKLGHVYPIVLGAHIGTCITGLLASFGTNLEARRTALSHLVFNILNVAIGVVLYSVFVRLTLLSSDDLIRQTANLHTLVITGAAIVLLPMTGLIAGIVSHLCRSSREQPPSSYLDRALLPYPEQALLAVIKELQRMAILCGQSFHELAQVMLFNHGRSGLLFIRHNERILDEVKLSLREYLVSLTDRELSRRQSLLVERLDGCMIDLERIGDHIEKGCELALQRRDRPEVLVDDESVEWLMELYELADTVVKHVITSLDSKVRDFQDAASNTLDERDLYAERSVELKDIFADKISGGEVTPLAGMYFLRLVGIFDRIVRHAKTIALAQQHDEFDIKTGRLGRHAGVMEDANIHAPVDPEQFLKRIEPDETQTDHPKD